MSVRWLAPTPIERSAADDCRCRRLCVKWHARSSRPIRTSMSCSSCPNKSPLEWRRSSRRCSYVLWDLEQFEGLATRRETPDECPETGPRRHDDPHDGRRGAVHHRRQGALLETLRIRFDKEIVAKTAAESGRREASPNAKPVSGGKRAHRAISLSPNRQVKARRGLLDPNTLFWISKYVYRVLESATSW